MHELAADLHEARRASATIEPSVAVAATGDVPVLRT